MFSMCSSNSLLQTLLVTAPAFILYSYNQAGFSALLKLPDDVTRFPQIDTINTHGAQKSTSSTIEGVVNGCLQLGALIGSLSCSAIGDKLGRRRSIFLAGLVCAIGQILQCASFSLPQLIVGRLVLGVGVGQLNVTVPVWQTESSTAGSRGRKVITAGIFISSASRPQVGSTLDAQEFHPLKINQPTKAREALARLNGIASDDRSIQLEISRIQHALESHPTSSIREIFNINNGCRLGYRFVLCTAIQTLQQLVGGSLVSIYTTTIFQDNLNLQGDIPQVVAASSLTWEFPCSFIAYVAVDRLGRRLLFVVSGTGMCLCMVVMTVTNSLSSSNQAASIISAVANFLFNLFYPIGFLGENFLYCAEVAPVRLRVAMSSISTANHWLWNFIIAMISPVALSEIGWKYYLVFVSTCAYVPIVVLPFFPETMGRNLELIDQVFRDAPTIWDVVPMARNLPRGDFVPESSSDSKDEITEHKEDA